MPKEAIVGLPYYKLTGLLSGSRGSVSFYGEAYFTLLAGTPDFFALAAPRLPGEPPRGGEKLLKPLAGPDAYASRALEALSEIRERGYTAPSFEFEGLRGMLKAVLYYMSGRKDKARDIARPTESLEWNLALDYVNNILGLRGVSGLSPSMAPVYVRLTLKRVGNSFEAYVWREGRPFRFRVLELLARKYDKVAAEVESILKD